MLNQPLKPMLLQPIASVVKNWPASLKWDGFRVLIHYDNGITRAYTRNGNEITSSFYPELSQIKLPVKNAILDGECICFDLTQSNQPPKAWWDDAMVRFHTNKERSVKSISQTLKAHFPVWDILLLNDKPLLKNSFTNRREALNKTVVQSDVISVTQLYDNADHLFSRAKELGLEGIVQYNPDSLYYLDSRPKNTFVKVKAYQYAICQVSSIKKSEFGWGLSINGNYVGMIEFPPSVQVRKEFNKVAKQIVCGENNEWIFIDPLLSCKVKFQCYTKDGSKLRSPTFEEFCTHDYVQ